MKNKINLNYSRILICLLVILFLVGCGAKGRNRDVMTTEDLSGKTVAIWIESNYDKLVEAAVENPRMVYADNYSDALVNLERGEYDAVVMPKSLYSYHLENKNSATYLEKAIGKEQERILFSNTDKSSAILHEFNKYLKEIKANGTFEELVNYWIMPHEGGREVDLSGLSENGEIINVGASDEVPPFIYVHNDQYQGFEMDLMARFCREYGYRINITASDSYGLISELENGHQDVGMAGYTLLDNKKEQLQFSDPIYDDDIVLVVKKTQDKESFIDRAQRSINETIIEDRRYSQFLNGLWVTLLITFPSILLGLVMGFGLYILKILDKKILNTIIRILCLIKGRVPDLVLLMIFYYIIFANVSSIAIPVAILTFTYLFAVTVYENLNDNASSVSKGQYDSAFVLGYSKVETFWYIILPQIMPSLLDVFKKDFVSHMLETSIVGLIAITDLTGAGNRIRSLTFHSFSPIIIVTILYFAISTIVIWVVSMVQKRVDFTKRSKKQILKDIVEN